MAILKWTFKETRQKNMGWPHLIQNKYKRRSLVSKVMNIRIPKNAKNFLTSQSTVSFSTSVLHAVNYGIK